MRDLHFGDWAEVLAATNLPERNKRSWAITLRWYLSFCRRSRVGVNVQSARDFIAWAQTEKQPQPWQIEEWKAALNWFFREAKKPGSGGRETLNSESLREQASNIER